MVDSAVIQCIQSLHYYKENSGHYMEQCELLLPTIITNNSNIIFSKYTIIDKFVNSINEKLFHKNTSIS